MMLGIRDTFPCVDKGVPISFISRAFLFWDDQLFSCETSAVTRPPRMVEANEVVMR